MQQDPQRGYITVERRNDGSSVASELFGPYPLRFHVTSHHEHDIINRQELTLSRKALTCYVLGYGGGLISGDTISLNIKVKPNASLVLTSQSTSKAFKAVSGRKSTTIRTDANIARGALLFLVPQPTQCFGGARLRQETHVIMEHGRSSSLDTDGDVACENNPSLLLVDWYTGGRRNLDGGIWKFDSFESTTTVSYSCINDDNIIPEKEVQSNSCRTNNSSHGASLNSEIMFQDATHLTGGEDLARHMRDFNVVCMVVLIGPRLKEVADLFRKKFSSRQSFKESQVDDKEGNFSDSNSQKQYASSRMGYNRGDGLNKEDEGLIVSCGNLDLPDRYSERTGVIVRLAASTVEKAAKLLSKHIGTLDGQLEDDPFMEILSSKQGIFERTHPNDTHMPVGEKLRFGLLDKSFREKHVSCSQTLVSDDDVKLDFAVDAIRKERSIMKQLIMYQLVDSCCPTGSFAHSNTLEAAHQLHLLRSPKSPWKQSLVEHTWDVVLQTFTSAVPFLISTCSLLRSHIEDANYQSYPSLDMKTILPKPQQSLVEAWYALDVQFGISVTTSQVARRASTLQGSGILRAFACSFPHIAPVIKALKLKALRESQSDGDNDSCGHSTTCFGAVCGLLGVDNETCVSMFLYTTSRDMINAAVRMNLCGPLEGGRLTNELCQGIEMLVDKRLPDVLAAIRRQERVLVTSSTNSSTQRISGSIFVSHQVAPIVEILSNAHDRLYTRLFNS